MGRIIRLDERLSNKIAAGEVVERPASVVKELVENAVDANSTQVDVEIEEGGLSKIKVVDNGDGIMKEDCELAFQRHATSKIASERDLFHIRTLGFRGEALPSIASVSRLEMKTGTGGSAGTHCILEGGRLVASHLSDGRKGTEITVSQLFYNTPARLKHLKTVHTELGNITDVIYRMALANPHVAFKLIHHGKKVFQSNGNGDVRQGLASIYGVNTARKMTPIHAESLDFIVSGFATRPEVTRASRQHMLIFMNARYIRNYPVSRAILEAYHTLLPIRRYPIAMVHIEMDPTLIDVNVHPSKLEVRLSKERELCQLVEHAIKEAFRKCNLIPESVHPVQKDNSTRQEKFSFEHSVKDFSSNQISRYAGHPLPSKNQEIRESGSRYIFTPSETETADQHFLKAIHPSFREYAENHREQNVLTKEQESVQQEQDTPARVPALYPIGQAHGTYILAQNEEGLYIIDQHAAQERIKYEFYREKVGEVTSDVQELLIPITFEFSSAEMTSIGEHMEELKAVGIFLEPFGPESYLVRSHPSWFPEGFEKETIEELVFQVMKENHANVKKLREEAAILMSCKRSIKANHRLSMDEMFALLEELRRTDDPFTCPHGRPVILRYSIHELEKMFKRVM